MTAHLGTAERTAQDLCVADEAYALMVANKLRDLARPGFNVHMTVHIDGESVSVKLETPPHRWRWDGSRMKRVG